MFFYLAGCGRGDDTIKKEPVANEKLGFQDRQKHSFIVAFKEVVYQPVYREDVTGHFSLWQSLVDHIPLFHQLEVTPLVALNLASKKITLLGQKEDLARPRSMMLQWFELEKRKPAFISRVDFSSEKKARETIKLWKDDDLIWYAEPNFISRIDVGFADHAAKINEIKGNSSAKSRFIERIDLDAAFAFLANQTIEEAPIIAVLDSGVDYFHPALQNRILISEAGAGDIGCPGGVYGCNTTASFKRVLGDGAVHPASLSGPNQPCAPNPYCHHGTHVAGIVAAEPQTDENYLGVCPICKILPVKIVGGSTDRGESESGILDSSIIAGLTYVTRFRKDGEVAVRVINASFGKFQRSKTIELLISALRHLGRGTLIVAAAGNEDTMLRQYPAAFSDVLAVANVNAASGLKDPSSNFGPWVDLSSPGAGECTNGGIRSAVPGGGSECFTGTSMAAPVVAGVAGLLLAMDPSMTYDELRQRILSTVDPIIYDVPSNEPYHIEVDGQTVPVPLLGNGVVNASNAVTNNVPENQPALLDFTDRVTSSCGTISSPIAAGNLSLFLMLSPLWLFWSLGMKRDQAPVQKAAERRPS